MPKGKLFIGTSGWIYSHWDDIFYPKDLPSKDKPPHQYIGSGGKLKYYSRHFKTVEVNYSFYHLPRPSTYQNWYKQTPEDFLFAVKASRFITHIKRLKGVHPHTKRGQIAEGAKIGKASPRYGVGVKEAWRTFRENALNLKEKLGPILFQFPPSFKATPENLKRLEDFLKLITKNLKSKLPTLKFAFEFRHKSWSDKKIYQLLKKYKVSWVIADSPSYPKVEEVTANFVYLRMHGSQILFSSKYTTKELKDLAQKIKKWLKTSDVYVYFNNDAYGYAIENAKMLKKLII